MTQSDRQMRDRMEVAGLAHKRYPERDILLAVAFFESDRRKAGFGALAKAKGRHHTVQNSKRFDMHNEYVHYSLSIHRDAHTAIISPFAFNTPFDYLSNDAPATFQTHFYPPVTKALRVPFELYMFKDQTGRNRVAKELRRMRNKLRSAINET